MHLVFAALLSPRNSGREDFPSLIADIFAHPMPNLSTLGLAADEEAFVKAAVSGGGGLRSAMANLAGGRWGLAQFAWIPRAVEFDLGPPIADAFRTLVAGDQPLGQRVDSFRDQLYIVGQALEKKGGFLPDWRLFRVSLSFAAVVLGGFDPARYTFYSKGALRYGYEQYAAGTDWPNGTMGETYTAVCEFVGAVAQELRAKGVPVRDLIDAQSFVWIKFRESNEPKVKEAATAVTAPRETELDRTTIAVDLAKSVYWPLDRAQHLVELVHRWGQVLFQGPPGTGKTFVAETLARLLSGDEDGRVEIVQFHPSYAYEDFVEGIRPVVTEGSTLAYEIRKGIFLKLTDVAKQHLNDEFFLVIDELNRANLPRVFGELLYALEYRGPQHTFRLPYSGAEAYVPQNITFIATMNTADRSIALVDAAIRRRFHHVQFNPDPDVLKAWMSDNGLADMAAYATGRLVALNEQLIGLLDSERLIGHTYLMRKDLREVGLDAVWEEDVEPVLREHLFNQPEEVAKLRDVFLASR
ncbi:MAG: AAA family ATPase [Candidatus Dormibacteraeota bacterium]|nr:AAA family ATPase [Candidatus Dormibacteraeota bacterium]